MLKIKPQLPPGANLMGKLCPRVRFAARRDERDAKKPTQQLQLFYFYVDVVVVVCTHGNKGKVHRLNFAYVLKLDARLDRDHVRH